jgi:hypothetical protein
MKSLCFLIATKHEREGREVGVTREGRETTNKQTERETTRERQQEREHLHGTGSLSLFSLNVTNCANEKSRSPNL